MGIVREAYKIGIKLMRPTQKRFGILLRPRATGAVRRFRVDADASKKERLAIQQDLLALNLNRAKAHVIF